jgi:hypothetical protein
MTCLSGLTAQTYCADKIKAPMPVGIGPSGDSVMVPGEACPTWPTWIRPWFHHGFFDHPRLLNTQTRAQEGEP